MTTRRAKTLSRYRSQAGIVYDILNTIAEEGPMSPTRIMYGARLPYDRLKNMLEHLEEQGLVKKIVEDDRVFYDLTPKGVEVLEELRRVRRLLQSIGIRF